MNIPSLYKIVNTQNSHFYIGSTLNFHRRKRAHTKLLSKGKHDNKHLQFAWEKYGENSFVFELIKIFTTDREAVNEEQKWLDEHIGKPYFYNISAHARLDPQQARKLISEKLKGKNNPMYGKTHSPEVKQLLREMKLGKPIPQERKDRISKTLKKMYANGKIKRHSQFGKKNPFYGKTHSDSTRKILSELAKKRKPMLGRVHSPETKEKLRQIALRRVYSKETREKMRLSALRRATRVISDHKFANHNSNPHHLGG